MKAARAAKEHRSPGHEPVFLCSQEEELEMRLLRLAERGFPLTSRDIRRAAFSLAERLQVPHHFRKDRAEAGVDWFTSFMKRHPSLARRQAEGLLRARASSLMQERAQEFYNILEQVLSEYGLVSQPHKVYNMDETGCPLNNKPGKVITRKGEKAVYARTNNERGKNVTVAACCNAISCFVPPFIIYKGKRMKDTYKDNLPAGTEAVTSDTGYMKEDVFLLWLKHFVKFKPGGVVLLILDGHASHVKSFAVTQYCIENNIEMLCLPSHTTHVLQPLDKSFFKPFKTFYNQSVNQFVYAHPGTVLSKCNFGKFFGPAWTKAATVQNATAGFQSCGIVPFNRWCIPEHLYTPQENAASEGASAPATELR